MSDQLIQDFFPNTVAMDLFRSIVGDPLGSGVARHVYAMAFRDDLVVKFETTSGSFQNVLEWKLWRDWKDTESVAKWLAPVESISPCGTVLIQRRTEPVPRDQLPSRLPFFLTDTKISNYGLMDGRVVCHDYGMIILEIETKLRKADWW